MPDKCVWPKCHQPCTGAIKDANGKTFELCDAHNDMVQDENDSRARRSRKKLGMSMPYKIRGYIVNVTSEESKARCAVKGCGHPISLVIYTDAFPESTRGMPVCMSHYRAVGDDLIWDGAWHKFIPGCVLDDAPLFGEDVGVEEKSKDETVPKEDARSWADRLASGDFDAPED